MVNLTKNATVNNANVKENGMENFINDLFNMATERFDGSVEKQEICKNNEKLIGFTFRERGNDTGVAPTVYPESYYEAYSDGDLTLEEICDGMLRVVRENADVKLDVDVSDIVNWEAVKDRIVPCVISKNNKELLEKLAYSDTKTDLAIIYSIVLGQDDGGMANVKVTKEIKEKYGVTMTELKKCAFANLKKQITFKSMAETLMELMGEEMAEMMGVELEDSGMYVLSIESKTNGASAMFAPSVLKNIAKKVKKDTFYILPSSIHEVLVVTLPDAQVGDLKNMVMNVNATEVSPQERLSDSVYFFDGKQLTVAA